MKQEVIKLLNEQISIINDCIESIEKVEETDEDYEERIVLALLKYTSKIKSIQNACS